MRTFNINDAFKELESLNEDININLSDFDSAKDNLTNWVMGNFIDEYETAGLADVYTDSTEDIDDEVEIECNVCKELFPISRKDLEEDNVSGIYNREMACPKCGRITGSGFTLKYKNDNGELTSFTFDDLDDLEPYENEDFETVEVEDEYFSEFEDEEDENYLDRDLEPASVDFEEEETEEEVEESLITPLEINYLNEAVDENVKVGQSYHLAFDNVEDAENAIKQLNNHGLYAEQLMAGSPLVHVYGNKASEEVTKAVIKELGLEKFVTESLTEGFSVIDLQSGESFGNFDSVDNARLKALQYYNLGLAEGELVIVDAESKKPYSIVKRNGTIKNIEDKDIEIESLNESKSHYYCVYELDEDGDEIDNIDCFNTEKKAITFAKKQPFPTHVVEIYDPDGYDADTEVVWSSLDEACRNESLNESDKPAAQSIEDAQKWVDYDMERYGKISNKTNDLVKKAGFQIIKDDHGDYEVAAGKFESLEEKCEECNEECQKEVYDENKCVEACGEKDLEEGKIKDFLGKAKDKLEDIMFDEEEYDELDISEYEDDIKDICKQYKDKDEAINHALIYLDETKDPVIKELQETDEGKNLILDAVSKIVVKCESMEEACKKEESKDAIKEQINLPGYGVEYISGYAGNGVNRIERKFFRTKEEQEKFVKELKSRNARGVETYFIDNFYHTKADESLKEDTVKQDGKWVNKGDDGETHGKFNTKKEADAQRKAMFANGYKGEALEEDALDDHGISWIDVDTLIDRDRDVIFKMFGHKVKGMSLGDYFDSNEQVKIYRSPDGKENIILDRRIVDESLEEEMNVAQQFTLTFDDKDEAAEVAADLDAKNFSVDDSGLELEGDITYIEVYGDNSSTPETVKAVSKELGIEKPEVEVEEEKEEIKDDNAEVEEEEEVEFDESIIDESVINLINEEYDDVKSYVTTSGTIDDNNKIVLEGVITFNDDTTHNTTTIVESIENGYALTNKDLFEDVKEIKIKTDDDQEIKIKNKDGELEIEEKKPEAEESEVEKPKEEIEDNEIEIS